MTVTTIAAMEPEVARKTESVNQRILGAACSR